MQFTWLGYTKDQILKAFVEVSKSSPNEDLSSLWPAVLCYLREVQIYCFISSLQEPKDWIQRLNNVRYYHLSYPKWISHYFFVDTDYDALRATKLVNMV